MTIALQITLTINTIYYETKKKQSRTHLFGSCFYNQHSRYFYLLPLGNLKNKIKLFFGIFVRNNLAFRFQ